jgi:hypothetical protein
MTTTTTTTTTETTTKTTTKSVTTTTTTAAFSKSDQVTLILIIVTGKRVFRVNPKLHLQSEHENALSFSLRKQSFEVGLEVSTFVSIKTC